MLTRCAVGDARWRKDCDGARRGSSNTLYLGLGFSGSFRALRPQYRCLWTGCLKHSSCVALNGLASDIEACNIFTNERSCCTQCSLLLRPSIASTRVALRRFDAGQLVVESSDRTQHSCASFLAGWLSRWFLAPRRRP
jgi:hypothetical protein